MIASVSSDTTKKKPDCFPTAQQELLLRASLLDGEEALEAWHDWLHNGGDIEDLDSGSYRILPLLYKSLQKLAVKDPRASKVKGVYRLTFYKNQSLFFKMVTALRELQEAGVETIVLKGASLALLHYKDVGLRPMFDLDVLVPTRKASAARTALTRLGWEPLFQAPHSQAFRCTDGGVELDLHWHTLLELSETDSDDEFWNGAVKAEIHGLEVLALNPTDLLFHVCVHGLKWERTPTIRWIADASMILQSSDEIDWQRLIQQGQRHRLTLPLREALKYLKNLLNAPIPDEVLARLEATPISIQQRLDYASKTCEHSERGPLLTLWAYYSEYIHWSKSHGASGAVIGFPNFLKHLWGVKSVWQVPVLAGKGFLNRSFNVLKKQLS